MNVEKLNRSAKLSIIYIVCCVVVLMQYNGLAMHCKSIAELLISNGFHCFYGV